MYQVWPKGLRAILQEGRQVTLTPSYETADPVYGPPYIRATTDDTPVFITGSLLLSKADARRLQWFIRKINGGKDKFEMPIKSEYGVVNQICQALPGSFNPTVIGGLFKYNISIVISDWKLPPFAEYEDDFIEIGWRIPESFSIFDKAMNHYMPEA